MHYILWSENGCTFFKEHFPNSLLRLDLTVPPLLPLVFIGAVYLNSLNIIFFIIKVNHLFNLYLGCGNTQGTNTDYCFAY